MLLNNVFENNVIVWLSILIRTYTLPLQNRLYYRRRITDVIKNSTTVQSEMTAELQMLQLGWLQH